MDFDLTKEGIDMVARLAMIIPIEDARELLNEINRTDVMMPFIDPTAYHKIMYTLPNHRDAVNAFITYRRSLAEILEREKANAN